MKTLIAAGIMALSIAPIASTAAKADDVGASIARGAIRGALGDGGYGDRGYGDRGYGYRDDYRRDRYEGRTAFGGDCKTVTIERDDGSVKRIRRCD